MDRHPIPRWTRFLSVAIATALAAACQPANPGDPPQDPEDDTVSTGQTTGVVPNNPEPIDQTLVAALADDDQSRLDGGTASPREDT